MVFSALGVDPSLTSTGVALFEDGKLACAYRVPSGSSAHANISARCRRIDDVVNLVEDAVLWGGPLDLLVLEGPAYGLPHGRTWDRAGLWWAIYVRINRPTAIVPPLNLKKYVTGSARGDKVAMIDAIRNNYDGASKYLAEAGKKQDDVADAIGLAAMGSRYLGLPVERQAPLGVAAMMQCEWPDISEEK